MEQLLPKPHGGLLLAGVQCSGYWQNELWRLDAELNQTPVRCEKIGLCCSGSSIRDPARTHGESTEQFYTNHKAGGRR